MKKLSGVFACTSSDLALDGNSAQRLCNLTGNDLPSRGCMDAAHTVQCWGEAPRQGGALV